MSSTPATATPATPTPEALARLLKDEATRLGFIACGITTAEPFPEAEAGMLAAVDAGYLSGMPWFTRERVHLASTPTALLPEARSLVVLAAPYRTPEPPVPADGVRGRVARYAWGDDYHETVKARLRALVAFLERIIGRRPAHRLFVDSSPLNEGEAARRAGVGWVGKNTLVLVPGIGSYVVLGALLLDLALTPDAPLRKSCGSCDLCLRACPTQAFPAPYVLDANRCIAYLTIEHRGDIPADLRPLMGDHLFGCDVCQEVCPVNRKSGPLGWPAFSPREDDAARPLLEQVLTMDTLEYQRRYRGRPLKRTKERGLKRNAAVAAGNSGDPGAVPALTHALHDPAPLVRSHAAWALGRIGGDAALAALRERLTMEEDAAVLTAIREALRDDERGTADARGPS